MKNKINKQTTNKPLFSAASCSALICDSNYEEGYLFIKPDDTWGEYIKGTIQDWFNEKYKNSVIYVNSKNQVFVDLKQVGVIEKFIGWRTAH